MKKEATQLISKAIEKPIRAFLLIILIITMLFASIAYSSRSAIYQLIIKNVELNKFKSKLYPENYKERMAELLANRRGVSATIWKVDIDDLSKEVIYSYHHEYGTHGREKYIGKQAPLYGDKDNAWSTIQAQRGDVTCYENGSNSYVERLMHEEDKTLFTCTVSVPPRTGNFMALISISFERLPKISNALLIDFRKASRGITEERKRISSVMVDD